MRLFELAYCCRLYAALTGFDAALDRFREGIDAAVDLSDRRHRALSLQYCGIGVVEAFGAKTITGRATPLRPWWMKWSDALPSPGITLDSLGDDGLEVGAEGFVTSRRVSDLDGSFLTV